jgi:hypothetical protein
MRTEEETKTKYTIIKDEKSCFGPAWCINDHWLEEGEYLEDNEELIDYLLIKLKEGIKKRSIDVESLIVCFQCDDYEYDKGSCETCGHFGGKTTWVI